MKILLVGHFDQSSGWGLASNSIAEALDNHPGVELVCRNVSLSGESAWNPTVKKCEEKDSRGSEYCIQVLLPHYMQYAPFKKCVGMFYNETSNYLFSSWSSHLNLMDEIWTPYDNIMSHRASGVFTKHRVINQPINTEVYRKDFIPMPFKQEGDFVFYFIGELNKRKNITGLLKAFHKEFGPHDNVKLVIKTSAPGMSPDKAKREVEGICNSIKNGMKIRRIYQEEIIITERLTDDGMYSLHKGCDCFVMPSHGEAVCLPIMDALGFGNYVIATNTTGISHVLKNADYQEGLVDMTSEDVFGEVNTFSDLFTGRENWDSPDMNSLCLKMRAAKDGNMPKPKTDCLEEAFSYSSVAKSIIDALEAK
jgi:glycosyltransferase involved in cell wall biosynthesis